LSASLRRFATARIVLLGGIPDKCLNFQYLMAVSTVTVLPVIVIFFVAQKYFIQGVVMSGIKG